MRDIVVVIGLASGLVSLVSGGTACGKTAGLVPVALATREPWPRSLVVDDAFVYWVRYVHARGDGDSDGDSDGDGEIVRVSKRGGTVSVLCAVKKWHGGFEGRGSLALDRDFVYFTTEEGVYRVSKRGGSPEQLVRARLFDARVTVDDAAIYWTDSNTGTVQRIAKNGGEPTILAHDQLNPMDPVVAAGVVYWITGGDLRPTDDYIRSVPSSGGEVRTVAEGEPVPIQLWADGEFLYWLNNGTPSEGFENGSLVKLAAGERRTVVSPLFAPDEFAVRGDTYYILTEGALLVSKGDGSLSKIRDTGAISLAVDEHAIYVSSAEGTIWRIPRREN